MWRFSLIVKHILLDFSRSGYNGQPWNVEHGDVWIQLYSSVSGGVKQSRWSTHAFRFEQVRISVRQFIFQNFQYDPRYGPGRDMISSTKADWNNEVEYAGAMLEDDEDDGSDGSDLDSYVEADMDQWDFMVRGEKLFSIFYEAPGTPK